MPDSHLEIVRLKAVATRAMLRNIVLQAGVASHPSAVDDIVARMEASYEISTNTGKKDAVLLPTSKAPYRMESPGQMSPGELLEHMRASGEVDFLFAEPTKTGNSGKPDNVAAVAHLPADFHSMNPEEKLRIANERTKPAGF